MPQKAKSATTSSKSNTSKPLTGDGIDTPVQFVKGVGPRLGAVFSSRGISTVRDLLFFFPRAYEDRSKMPKVSELAEGVSASVSVQVAASRLIRTKFGKSILEVRATDSAGESLSLKWFHVPRGMDQRFKPGVQLIVTGQVKAYMSRFEMIHPEITWNAGGSSEVSDAGEPHVGRVVPIYTEIEGISTRVLRKILWEALQKFAHLISEDLPEKYRATHHLPGLAKAISEIHFPPEKNIEKLVAFDTPSHWRLIYEEFLKFEYLVLRQRLRTEKQQAPSFGDRGGRKAVEDLEKLLPFKLTGDQKKAVKEILEDLAQPHPMNRLIQGDVGSGKTAVSFLTSACVLAEGGQAALMAPTEILADQHYKNAVKLFGGRLNVALLTGKTPQSERNILHAKLAAGEPTLLIGTHALIEDPVVFKNLVYIMIDEQHRFGVEQRRTLRNKGIRKQGPEGKPIFPHSLVLTATPIPRTLALTAYGDLSVTSIQEMPPGRSPIKTEVVREKNHRGRSFEKIRQEIRDGHQAYFIYPLVNDSEAEGFTALKSAVAEAEKLTTEVFPEFKVGLLHGQMRPDEKLSVMEKFKRGEIQILVSTTVVEVGVDVPNATIMAIEHADRFGLSQLHQLRGRVGRGSAKSFCYLFSHPRVGETTAARLEVLEETNDGFKIAEADLEIRGPGEFLGTRQAGSLPFRLANLVRDRDWLLKAREDALELLRDDPDLISTDHLLLRRYFEREGKLQFERLRTS